MDVIIFYVIMVLGATYLEEGGPNKDSYACPVYCAANHKHLALKDTTVVYSNMAKNDNTGFLSGLFNLIGGKQGTEIDALPLGDASIDNLKEKKRKIDTHQEQLKEQMLARQAAVHDMQMEDMQTEMLINSVIPDSDKAFETMPPDKTKTDMLVKEASYDMNRDYPEDLYNAIMHAEHRGGMGKEGYNPWIRTQYQVPGGSNAFGPVQLLSSTFGRMPMTKEGKPMINYTPEELEFLERYKQQGQEFYKHGGEKGKIADYDSRFDYGGEGYGYNDEEKALYESAAKKLIGYEWKRANTDLDTFIKRWRFGDKSPKGYEHDTDYYDIVRKHMNP